jgi:drug/metabolite transporter (DMT)-like permease
VLGDVTMSGMSIPWWAPLLLLACTTAVGYATSIAASQLLGSRLMSFVGMLEVVFACVFAWIALGEALSLWQIFGGALILAGIACVRAEKAVDAPLEAVPVPEPAPTRS